MGIRTSMCICQPFHPPECQACEICAQMSGAELARQYLVRGVRGPSASPSSILTITSCRRGLSPFTPRCLLRTILSTRRWARPLAATLHAIPARTVRNSFICHHECSQIPARKCSRSRTDRPCWNHCGSADCQGMRRQQRQRKAHQTCPFIRPRAAGTRAYPFHQKFLPQAPSLDDGRVFSGRSQRVGLV